MRTLEPVNFTRERAEYLAETIRAYWRVRGHEIKVWVEPISRTYASEFAVRSNLRLGARRLLGRDPGSLSRQSRYSSSGWISPSHP